MPASPSRLPRAALAAAFLASLAAGCSEPAGRAPSFVEKLGGPGAAKRPSAAAPAPAALPLRRPTPDGTPATTSPRRYAGGRPVAWWSERLSRLRREGPADLYALTRERARLNGLDVVEKDGGEVAVLLRPVAEARP